MTKTSKTIIFFGTDSFSAPALTALIDAGYFVGAVVTKPDSRSGRGQQMTPPIVKTVALEHDIPVWQPEKLSDIADDISALRQESGDLLGILSSYGKIIPQAIIDLFTPGIVNIHPSLLPKYRGPSPIETAIYNGDKQTGVSIMLLSAAMDAGPIYTQETYPLNGSETQTTLYKSLSAKGSELLISVLPDIMSGSLAPTPQQDDKATYTHLLKKSDALINPQSITAVEAERHIRAYLEFPKTKLTLSGQLVTVLKAHVGSEDALLPSVVCRNNTWLIVDELTGPSGRKMSGKDFLNGYAAA